MMSSSGSSGRLSRITAMDNRTAALEAIQALQSLPNWEQIAAVYGGLDEHLQDLADDLQESGWDDLA